MTVVKHFVRIPEDIVFIYSAHSFPFKIEENCTISNSKGTYSEEEIRWVFDDI